MQKVVSALRRLAYGSPPDSLCDYTGLSESTSRKSLKRFCAAVVERLGGRYLRRPDATDLKNIERVYRSKDFPGCIAILDCAGWECDLAPVAYQGRNRGKSRRCEVRMEVVADELLWIWHVFFGCPWSFNDSNILHCSPLFADVRAGAFPLAQPAADIDGFSLTWFYGLVDGIHPRWSRFVSAYRDPSTPRQGAFNLHQEGVQKSVERAFGVLFKRFNLLYLTSRFHDVDTMRSVLLNCVILHNMCVGARRDGYAGCAVVA